MIAICASNKWEFGAALATSAARRSASVPAIKQDWSPYRVSPCRERARFYFSRLKFENHCNTSRMNKN